MAPQTAQGPVSAGDEAATERALRITVGGRVQGVGFRPQVYRNAIAHGLRGWVRNGSGRVLIHAQGQPRQLDAFVDSLQSQAPPLAAPVIEAIEKARCDDFDRFSILTSSTDAEADIHLPADLFTCDDCLREMNDPRDRRYRYPFINCTQCGPRYTLIEALPYDRASTSMAAFDLCPGCAAEYADPADRRYHAEPIACPECGPTLSFAEAGKPAVDGNESALEAACAAIAAGKVIAIKGIGGYHLVCAAEDDAAVQSLRRTKPRPHKPLAVMFPAPASNPLEYVNRYLAPSALEAEQLQAPARPIVLVRKPPDCRLSAQIAPGLAEVGAMLPYSPLHHLLLAELGQPLVATSANISGEPVLTDNAEVERRLAPVAQGFLHHDRAILRPADDPLLRVIDGAPLPLRLGRGVAPLEIELPFALERPLLAVGAQMKNTVALAWDDRALISPHIGEMDNRRSQQTFDRCVEDLQRLYAVRAESIVCDAHPGYSSTRWARAQALPRREVFHHHAHAAVAFFEALVGDPGLEQALVFTWDGVGLGPDGGLWGGEALLGRPGQWRRRAHFRPFRLPGGERAGREPWRSAAALYWEQQDDCPLPEAADPLLHRFWQQGRNAPATTAAGRLFDAAAALCGVCSSASFEGQGPMQLEALAADYADDAGLEPFPLELSQRDEIHIADWSPWLPLLAERNRSAAARAALFHRAMAEVLLQQALCIRDSSGVNTVGLCGGVFQNRVLTELALARLRAAGFRVVLPQTIPVNDAGISFGQVVEAGLSPDRVD